MKKIGILIIFMIVVIKLFGQAPKIYTETEIQNYLLKNVPALDYIEGIWSIEKMNAIAYYKNKSLGIKDCPTCIGKTFSIIKAADKYEVYYKSEEYFIATGDYYESKGIPGKYFYHNTISNIPHTSNALMDDLFSLEYIIKMDYRAVREQEMFIAMAKQSGESNTNNFDEESEYKYTKIFPKYSDYQNATVSKPKPVKSTGTGFAISLNGYIVTNYHVIEGAEKLSVRGINGDFTKVLNAKTILTDKNNDLAIIQIEDALFKTLGTIPYSIKTTTSEVGEQINVLGYPLTATMGEEIKFTNGIISSKSGFQGDITCYQCSAPIQPGNSGGPMFDKNGNIVGIINAKHTNAENVSYAIKSSYLLNLIQSLPNPPKNSINTLSNKLLIEQVKVISKFVFIIEKS